MTTETEALEGLAEVYRAAGDLGRARASWNEVRAIHEANDRPRNAEAIERKLADLAGAAHESS